MKRNASKSSSKSSTKDMRSRSNEKLDRETSILLANAELKPVDNSSADSDQEISDKYKLKKHSSKSKQQHEEDAKNGLKKDYWNIALLMFLYFLQGIPLGLTGSMPFILSSRHVSYADQGTFSFAFWPFSLKLLWAPIVDAVFIKRFGRRKSWLIPIQYLLGAFMLLFSSHIREILDSHHHSSHTGKFQSLS